MTLKEFCSVYGGFSLILYIPREYKIDVTTWREWRSAIDTYGNYRVTYFDIYAYSDGDFSLNVTIEK